jgi:hypothetical protein
LERHGDVPDLPPHPARRERYRTWRWARRDQTVCVVCEPVAHDGGAVRVVDRYERVQAGGLSQHVRRVA